MKELPRVWFFAVGNDRIVRSIHRPKPFIKIPRPPNPIFEPTVDWQKAIIMSLMEDDEYRLTEINECDRVAVYR